MATLALAARLQGAIAYVNTDMGDASLSATTVATAGISHTAGNAIVCMVSWESSANTVTGLANTAGDTFTEATSARNTSDTNLRMDIWFALNSAGNATDIVTATYSATSVDRIIICDQYSGVATAAALDQANHGYASGANTAACGNLVTTSANEVVIGFLNQLAIATFTASSGFTLRGSAVGNVGHAQTEDQIVSATGTYAPGGSSGSFANFAVSCASFKQTGGAAAAVPLRMLLGVGQ